MQPVLPGSPGGSLIPGLQMRSGGQWTPGIRTRCAACSAHTDALIRSARWPGTRFIPLASSRTLTVAHLLVEFRRLVVHDLVGRPSVAAAGSGPTWSRSW